MNRYGKCLVKSILLAVFVVGTLPVFAHNKSLILIRSSQKNLRRSAPGNLQTISAFQIRTQLERALVEGAFSAPIQRPKISITHIKPLLEGKRIPFPSSFLQISLVKWESFPGKEVIDAVIFDMDGTLLDSLPAWEHSASNFLRSQGIEPEEGLDEEMAQLSLYAGAKIMKQRYALPQSVQEIMDLTLAPIFERYRTDIQAKPGVVELLKSLRAQGIKIGVATASDKKFALAAFERLGLKKYIRFITSCDEVGVGKRNSAVYDVTAARMGVKKERTLVVEDALYALKTAKKAGYLTAGVAEPFHSAEHNYNVFLIGDYFIRSFLDEKVLVH